MNVKLKALDNITFVVHSDANQFTITQVADKASQTYDNIELTSVALIVKNEFSGRLTS